MAGFAQYDQQVSPQPLAAPYDQMHQSRVTPDMLGANIGDIVAQGAERFARIAENARQVADSAQVADAYGQGKAALNQIILDPEKGYASLKGDDALKGRDAALKAYDDALKKAASSLTNEDQRRLWKPHEISLREQGFQHVISHEAPQLEDVARAKFEGAADQTMRALQSPGVISNPAALDQQLKDLQNVATGEALRRFGGNPPPEAVQSIVGKYMQKGAMDAMNGALATENPAIATSTFQRVGQYLGEHEHTYGNFVRGVASKAQISTESGKIIAAGMQQVPMPDGTMVLRVDTTKTAAALAALAPDTANLGEIQKASDTRERVLGDLWSKSAASVFERVHSAGQDPVTGAFDLQSKKISPTDKAWLNQYAPGELDKLRILDTKTQRQASGEDKITSAEYRSFVSADLHDTSRWADSYSKMTPGQFLSFITDEKQFPGGMLPRDRIAVQKEFQSLQQAGAKLEEPVGRTVKDQIAEAFPGEENAIDRKAFEGKWFGPLLDKANAFVAGEKGAGRKVDTEAVRKFIDSQLATVPNGKWFVADPRRIELDPASALQPPPVNAATPVAPAGRITVRNLAGKAFTLPPEQVDEFLKSPEGKGFSR